MTDALAAVESTLPEPPGFGDLLPRIVTPPPGPRSRAYAERLAAVEAPAISTLANGDRPIFWASAAGANVLDVDGNLYLDTTSAFGVASVGHRNPAVVAAVEAQARRLLHGMGDFLPPAVRLELAEALRGVLPRGVDRVLFGLSGADAVEIALKAAAVYTGKPGVVAFEGAFHGQSYGALAVTSRESFRRRFAAQLGAHVERAPYPYPYRRPSGCSAEDDGSRCLAGVDAAIERLARRGFAPGCVIVEPFQGREGEIFPPDSFLPGLRRLCDERGLLLIADEIYTGFGRTGRMWACEHTGVLPDLLCAGKALGGGLPGSIVAGRGEVLDAWRPDTPEAPHSSTFLGHPLGCAAALAVLHELGEHRLVERGARLGADLLAELQAAVRGNPHVGEVRGRGMMLGIELVKDRTSREPYPDLIPGVLQRGLERGLILLPAGMFGNVISLAPPLTITEHQLRYLGENLPEVLRASSVYVRPPL
ncbi:MAG TPA: aspartate aminotransferase family protein [Dehalococcoidia bacterium]|nr:aspartate aminotransferase family protein [Dehalococcoidia bacterium]